jgi:two-component sensor histidine kinase
VAEVDLNTAERRAALLATGLLDSPIDAEFDRITSLVSRLLRVPVALVSLVDIDRQFFMSSTGLPEPWASARQTPISYSFCQHVVTSAEPLIVEDASTNPVVCTNPAVTELGVSAYLGVPLQTPAGHVLGALCAIDTKVRSWSDEDIAIMKDMAAIVMREIALHREIAQRKNAEAQQQVLIAELHHRVKNTLAVVQSLVELSIRHTESLDAFRKSIAGRIASLAKSHTLLVEGQWLSIGLRTMIEGELEAHEGGDRISISGEEVLLPSRVAVAVGMAMHELITNAIKHGALSVPEGRVNVSWTVVPKSTGDILLLDWFERGGPTVLPPTRRGFGTLLLDRVLGPELGGKITSVFEPAGLKARIEAQLPAVAARV